MTTSKNGINLIKTFEGFRSRAYLDPVGIWTVGYGTTKINGSPVQRGAVITKEQAEVELIREIHYDEIFFKACISVPLNQNQYDALISFAYNVGTTKFKNSTLFKKLNSFDYDGAGKELLRWKYGKDPVTGKMKVLSGLERRRQAEYDLYRTPTDYDFTFIKPRPIEKLKIWWNKGKFTIEHI